MEGIALLVIIVFVFEFQQFLYKKYVFDKLDYRCEFSVAEVYEGDQIFLVEILHNRKLLPILWLKVDIHSSKWLDFAETNSLVTQENRRVTSSFFLRSHQKTTRRWKVKCLKRGVFKTENVTLISGDLLGTAKQSVPVGVNVNLTVYPEIIPLEEVFIPVNYIQGDTIIRRWIVDDPFMLSGVREYTPDDSMNRIHWQATAKEGRLMIRKNDFTSQLSITVVLNIQSDEYEVDDVFDKAAVELGIKVAATILNRALKMGVPVRLVSNGCTVDDPRQTIFTGEAGGHEHVGGLMKILAKMELKVLRDFEGFLKTVAIDGNLQQSDIIVITCYVNQEICDSVRDLELQNNRIKIIVPHPYFSTKDLPGDIEAYILSGVDVFNERKN